MKSKLNNEKIIVDGIKFDSKMESEYYVYLKSIYPNADIKLKPVYVLQSKFAINDKIVRDITYIPDFEVTINGKIEVHEVKGMATTDWKIKRKMFWYKYRDIPLKCVVKYQGKWVDWDENEERKRNNRKKATK